MNALSQRPMAFSVAASNTEDANRALAAYAEKKDQDHQAGVFSGAQNAQGEEGGGVKSKLAGGLVKALFKGAA